MPKAFDLRPGGVRDGQLGADGMEDAGHPRRLARLHAEGHHVLDLEVDGVADADRVAQAVLDHRDGRALEAQVLAHQRPERLHGTAEGPGENATELGRLVVGGRRVDEDAEPPVALAHDLGGVHDGGDRQATDVGPSTSPLWMLNTSTTLQRSWVAPSASDAVQGHTTSHEQVSKYDPAIFQATSQLRRASTRGDSGRARANSQPAHCRESGVVQAARRASTCRFTCRCCS